MTLIEYLMVVGVSLAIAALGFFPNPFLKGRDYTHRYDRIEVWTSSIILWICAAAVLFGSTIHYFELLSY